MQETIGEKYSKYNMEFAIQFFISQHLQIKKQKPLSVISRIIYLNSQLILNLNFIHLKRGSDGPDSTRAEAFHPSPDLKGWGLLGGQRLYLER